jgi:PmbA protein
MLDKNILHLTNTVNAAIEFALQQQDVTDVEVSGGIGVGFAASVRMQEVENIEFHNNQSIAITVYKNKVKGSATTASLLNNDVQETIKAACNIATYAQADEYAGLPSSEMFAKNIPDLQLYHPFDLQPEMALEYALACENAALNYDKRISNSGGASVGIDTEYSILANSHGFCAGYPTTRYSASVQVIATDNDFMQQDSEYTLARSFEALDTMEQVGKNAALKSIAKLGSTNIATTTAPVLFNPIVTKKILGSLISAISGSNLYRQASFCNNKLHTRLFPDFINIVERPHMLKAIGSSPFDSDGLARYDKDLIKDGMLATYLLSYYSAKRLGLQSTANAGGVCNVILQPLDDDFASLIKKMHTGLIVTSMMGHGTNIVTGDFSHGVSGFWVENGLVVKPVHEITIAGNLQDMFKQIVAVGNDLDYRGSIITGSMLVDKMTIAGS